MDQWPIIFEYDGRRYKVNQKAYDLEKIVLPDGRLLEADAWLESLPPKPQGLHEVNHTFQNLEPEEIARLMNAVVAEEA